MLSGVTDGEFVIPVPKIVCLVGESEKKNLRYFEFDFFEAVSLSEFSPDYSVSIAGLNQNNFT